MDLSAEFNRRFRPILAAERLRRDDAFLDPLLEIAGVPIVPLTIHHWALLDAIHSPLLVATAYHDSESLEYLEGALPLFPEELALTLWVLSTEYRDITRQTSGRSIEWHQIEFAKRMKTALGTPEKIKEAAALTIEHVRGAFADLPDGNGEHAAPTASHLARLVHNIAAEYHWPEVYIIRELPLVRLWQYLRLLESGHPDHIPSNPSDVQKGRIFQELLARDQRQQTMFIEPPSPPTLIF